MIRIYDAKLALFSAPDPTLVFVIDQSLQAWAVADERGVICFYGYSADMLGDEARVWFHAERPLDGYKITALRRCRRFVQDLQVRYATLYGTVDPESEIACKWIAWLGFKQTDNVIDVNGKRVLVAVREARDGN
jgi:hypothetical protein